MDYNKFVDGLEEVIENSITCDEEGDYKLNISKVTDAVVDYLEKEGLVIFGEEN